MRDFGYHNQVADAPFGETRRPQPPTTKTIPFDYVFQFDLTGTRGNKVQDVVEISMEGAFVALSLGYSLSVDEQKITQTFRPAINQTTTPPSPVLIPITPTTAAGQLDGFQLAGMPGAEVAILLLSTVSSPVIVGLGSGLGNSPTVIGSATLGPDGTASVAFVQNIGLISLVVRAYDKTNGLLGQLVEIGPSANDVIQTTPVIGFNPTTKKLPAVGDASVFVYGPGNRLVNLFLFEAATGNILPIALVDDSTPDNIGVISTIPVKETGVEIRLRGLVNQVFSKALAPGDLLLVSFTQDTSAPTMAIPFSSFAIGRTTAATLTLGAIEAGLESAGVDLTAGFRVNPNASGSIGANQPVQQSGGFSSTFLTGATSVEDVSFLYSMDVGATGREYQNKPIHNVAGLGIANGDRPFRPFAKPILFEPRTFIRIQVEEISGPAGKLFIVLQGYKTLGSGRMR